ncbi:hypothetical protein NXS98_13050 [Fontisphaera persica]|uniref:hypothetical protein n=1 Tax=Fontisphaera persica TaxID=2974023 RepID=UPI0024BFF081|nr:hypothetical protein [Fontisphaera persica]WCJ58640.1 hypothetical protein NXS98_13050 [Fontisphaera persica]
MITARQTAADERKSTAATARYRGVVVYLYAFDLAYDINPLALRQLCGQPVADYCVDTSKRSPRYLMLHRPLLVRLTPWERIGPHGPVRLEVTAKLFPVGAMSLSVRVPFAVSDLQELVEYHDLTFTNGDLYTEVRQLAEKIREELKSHFVRPVERLEEEEAYTVFCLESPLCAEDGGKIRAESWLAQHRREVAALLTQEPNEETLSAQEAEESTNLYLSYYEDDLTVVDWDAALVVDNPQEFEETLYILELANLQLAELEAYDRLLDDAIERSYRDLSGQGTRSRSQVMRELRELKIDLARFNDELSNITKFFGDWHLARIYQAVSHRFHLADWHRVLDGKLKTLDEIYHFLNADRTNRWMLVLEATIVLLFIIDLAVIVMGVGK